MKLQKYFNENGLEGIMERISDNKLSKDDLFILMESYKNNIQLNTTLLEQQKQLLLLHDTTTNKQKELCNNIDKLIEKLTQCSKTISDNQIKLHEEQSKLDDSIGSVSTQLSLKTADLSKEHASLANKMYISLVGMIGIVISVIGMAINYSDKFHVLTETLSKHIIGK